MKKFILIAASFLLFACSTDEPDETVGQQIADDYNAALEKAQDVENQVLEQKEAIDKALEDAESALEDP